MKKNSIKVIKKTIDVKKEKNLEENNNKLVITSRKPSKRIKLLCKQLRTILKPDCLWKLQNFHGYIQQCKKEVNMYQISHMIVLRENEVVIGNKKTGKTFHFNLVEYENNFKTFSNEVYLEAPFVAVFGLDNQDNSSNELKNLFKSLGLNEKEPMTKRLFTVYFEGDLIYFRHYIHYIKDSTDNYRVGLHEIGPRLTLKFDKVREGFYHRQE